MTSYFLALLFTLLIELFVIYLFGYRSKKIFITGICVNLITHPFFYYLLWLNSIFTFMPNNYLTIIVLEIIITLTESLLLYHTMTKNYWTVLKLSVAMNTTSFLIGLVLFKFFHIFYL